MVLRTAVSTGPMANQLKTGSFKPTHSSVFRLARPGLCRSVQTRRLVQVRAESNGTKQPKKETLEKIKKGMKEAGLQKDAAQQILKVWQATGLEKPEQLRKVLLGSSFRYGAATFLQLGLDVGAAYSCFLLASLWGVTNSLGGFTPFAQGGGYLLAGYFAAGAFFDTFRLGALIVASIQFGADAGAIYQAIRDLAGEPSGLSVVEKGKEAFNTVKVITALGDMARLLREKEANAEKPSTLEDLAAYLTLQRAREKLGFNPEEYGISDTEASKYAAIFGKYDANDDGRLQMNEFQAMIADLNPNTGDGNLTDADLKYALSLIDKNQSEDIDFVEFVAWLTGKAGVAKGVLVGAGRE